jgi:Flp pilus assembly protein TadB
MPLLTLLKLVPAKVWLIVAAILALALWYWRATDAAYERGKTESLQQIEKGTRDAEKRADTELRRLDRGDDSGVRAFDRDD